MSIEATCQHGVKLGLCLMCERNVKVAAGVFSEDDWKKANQDYRPGYVHYNDPVDAILSQRGRTHGEFKDNARLAGVWRAMLRETPNWKRLNWPQQLVLDEIVLKMARILSAGADPNCKEHWDDIAGYATLGGKACLKEEQKLNPDYCIACDREITPETHCGYPTCPHSKDKKVLLRTYCPVFNKECNNLVCAQNNGGCRLRKAQHDV